MQSITQTQITNMQMNLNLNATMTKALVGMVEGVCHGGDDGIVQDLRFPAGRRAQEVGLGPSTTQ